MTDPLLPDVEKALVAGLKVDGGVIGAGIATKVSTELPKGFDSTHGEKRIQLFRSTGGDVASGVIDRAIIQINAFGATKGEAFLISAVADSALKSLEGTLIDRVSISGVDRIAGPGWSPDPETDIPRYVSTFNVVTRLR
jgi:hypothetical protein